MPAPVYIGDEVSAAGYRLAGARVEVPEPGGEGAALAAARAQAPLVLISAAVAARIAERELRAALAALAPLTLIVPDLRGEAAVPDVAARLRHQLGLEG
jgi:vacuolar-type H+-ATPase subunit F/Vma7